ncbi:hypothetical protein [Campylobacter sputorum]|uniref:hypothetical protein n=1 Tax=Campylobacter sputorum TaxID=206 RepID=UPI00187B00C8|nr:hypothetical protein [Campylobacter sp. RM11302]MBE7358753.1 hypothetical protein [Campylobacter sp. RM11302]
MANDFSTDEALKEQRRKEKLLNIVNKEQYRLKLGIVYLFTSGFNLIAMIVTYLLYKLSGYSLDIVITLYLISIIFYYKYWFNYTKDGKHFDGFVFRSLVAFNIRVEKKLREMLELNSAKKIKE